MAAGDKFESRRVVYHDERTGREVWKMTSWDDAHCLATYMYLKAFSGDGRYLVFASDRTGAYELYRLEIESGETVQITDALDPETDDKSVTRYNVHPNGREVVYRDGNRFLAVCLDTLKPRLIAENTRSDWKPLSRPTLSGDGSRIICTYQNRDGLRGFAHADYNGSPLEDAFHWPNPDETVGHTQGATVDGLILSFVVGPDRQNDPSESREHRARAWKVDLAAGKSEPLLVMPPGHRATHEYWAPDGRLYFHKKSVPGWTPTSIASIDVNGDDFRDHYVSSDRKLGHSCISPDGGRIVSDVQDARGNELIQIDLKTGSAEILCWPDTTVANGLTGHVHPAYDFSGRYIVYTSDVSGKAAVYVVPV